MIRSVVALVLCADGANAQEFEAATVKPSPPPSPVMNVRGCRGGPQTADPAMYSCDAVPLWSLVGQAYLTPQYRLAIPKWMQDPQLVFDVRAKIPENATREEFFVMIQNLLKDRFHLVVHHESREIEQYDLVVGKNGPKFKDGSAPQPGSRPDGTAAVLRSGCPAIPVGVLAGNIDGQKVMYQPADDMALFVTRLTLELQKPVRDMTGLKGRYEIAMCWVPEGNLADPGPTLMEALQNQLGLRLESKKAPVDFVVIDSADKSPTPN